MINSYALSNNINNEMIKESLITNQHLKSLKKINILQKIKSFNDLKIKTKKINKNRTLDIIIDNEIINYKEKFEKKNMFNGSIMKIVDYKDNILYIDFDNYFSYQTHNIFKHKELHKILDRRNRENKNERRKNHYLNYLGMMFIIRNNKEFLLVQRNSNLGIEAGVISFYGGTPTFPEQNIEIGKHLENLVDEEMKEEFLLKKQDFSLENIWLSQIIQNQSQEFVIVVEIFLHSSIKELAKKCYNNEEVLKEHNVLYSVNLNKINLFIKLYP